MLGNFREDDASQYHDVNDSFRETLLLIVVVVIVYFTAYFTSVANTRSLGI